MRYTCLRGDYLDMYCFCKANMCVNCDALQLDCLCFVCVISEKTFRFVKELYLNLTVNSRIE